MSIPLKLPNPTTQNYLYFIAIVFAALFFFNIFSIPRDNGSGRASVFSCLSCFILVYMPNRKKLENSKQYSGFF